MPTIIFCEDPLNRHQPDDIYQAEATAAQDTGFDYALIDLEALVHEHHPTKATRRVPQTTEETIALYRGWMLKPGDYARLYDVLLQKGIRLINNPVAYQHCHYFPESYDIIKHKTPRSVWLPIDESFEVSSIMPLLKPFGNNSIIVKDYVKSQKHYWYEACFIPNASDLEAVHKTVTRFLELQGSDLNEGLIFREYVELEPLTAHSKSDLPLTKEFRVFVFNGTPLAVTEYWEEGDYQGNTPPLAAFAKEMHAIRSTFYTMDIAKHQNGEWLIIELGDGQVAGLPERIDPHMFYHKLAEMVL
ncbi:MAG: hypothetical protein GFH27_549289n72 [Chloroflexi bacterium AL-W]|nr:hypothetical protein [Chloroflexi bacterium AL-N1]NOK66804.1 hypothetical protein [Chloroflexi bacterium AL-N10]NOK74904.1 hypothetical protein [Chloroflexi bacterium AL-N5]NOK81407.1 hypothetical protein [Chloroflexi bacterium AL-W]NOK88876.1 hypothetical protein [Chloroflexi bacterium AL-N15]